MAVAIETEGLSKQYPLGTVGGYDTLREALSGARRRHSAERQLVWALREVSIAIEEGDSLGIVGRNGAGKTTLLRILARITEPTAGIGRVNGRVGALLEVGTGFHPELTGAENVYLGGALLGMRRSEVRRRFDEIVGFAGVEAFLDTPVKRYSTGMYLRLAFAVAAHLESEVLLVDEVLAVGDAEFQRRCLGKMGELGREGRTVIFVSHDAGAVTQLCRRALWLDAGSVVREGEAEEVATAYMDALLGGSGEPLPIPEHPGPVRLEGVEVLGSESAEPRRGEPLTVRLRLNGVAPPGLDLAVYLLDEQGHRVIDDALSDHAALPAGGAARHTVSVTLPPILRAGDYAVGVWIGTAHEEYLDTEVHAFKVAPRGGDKDEAMQRRRLVQPPVQWRVDGD
jgi:ABC-2 type transport system ATP-binding protein/lipopolysaccharide transport system ATP-binding protein